MARAAILDSLDDSRSIRLHLDLHPITEGDQVTLGLAALELAAQTANECALFCGNREEAGLRLDHQAGAVQLIRHARATPKALSSFVPQELTETGANRLVF